VRLLEEDKVIKLALDQFGYISIHTEILKAPKSVNGSVDDPGELFFPEVDNMLITQYP
jgi:hypothetical protein